MILHSCVKGEYKMPPSGHSRSSHSSSHSSHSSSRSSSRSHSSSSRSHSSSSHSSSYRANRFTTYGSSSSSSGSVARQPLRARSHQPSNYRFGSTHPTSTYQCRRHDYIFYPIDWLDETTNTTYKKGYYDEQGNRYDNLILKNNERYENVPMHCPYCDKTAVRDLTDDKETMSCEHCGGNMVIDAILDEKADIVSSYAGSASGGSGDYSYADSSTSRMSRLKPLLIFGIIFASMYIGPVLLSSLLLPFRGAAKLLANRQQNNPTAILQQLTSTQQSQQQQTQQQTGVQQYTAQDVLDNVEIFCPPIYLKGSADGMETGDSSDYDIILTWSDYDESYYDANSDCYVWFNTDVDPALWQYWYEGISSSYGDYGWMEYEDGTWYIETSQGNWEQIDVSGYGDRIWHFADPHATAY